MLLFKIESMKVNFFFVITFLILSIGFSQTSYKMDRHIKPENLRIGDTISIIAPSGVLKDYEEYMQKSISLMESWGLNVVLGSTIYESYGHFSSTDINREKDFQNAIDDNKIKAIWCARGGYGAMRIIDNINYDNLLKNPKWVIGYSDITAIHNDIHNLGVESLHGVMCKSLEDISVDDDSINKLKDILFEEGELEYIIEGHEYNIIGEASGKLVGGNLTLLQSLLQSKSSIDTTNKIIFIEDVGEYLYHIDRMLHSLKRADYFSKCSGLIVGDFTDIKKNETKFGKNLYEIINEIVEDYNFPVMYGFPAGHGQQNLPLIFGRNVQISVSENISEIRFSN
jgi:muramoyltetrapeptide carboxypeptidase